jgi:hypothetical protein
MAADDGTEDAGLAETIKSLRRELRKAQDDAGHGDVRFSVGSVEVELAIEVVKTAGGEASINVLNLLSIGGRGERSKSDTNRVKVVLEPVGLNGEPFEVAAAKFSRPDGRPDGRPGGRPGG